MAQKTDTTFDLFTRAIGTKIAEVTGLSSDSVFYTRSATAGYPRISYTATIWADGSVQRGTLSCQVVGKTSAGDVDAIAEKLRTELDDFASCSDALFYWLFSGRSDPVEDSDKSIYRRLVTFDFKIMGGKT